jgi:polyphosphate kinase
MGEDKYVFLNRDLSWLSFNYRVLMEAADKTVPLYSRISFLSIFSSNLDEFFRVRMPSIFAFTSIESKKISIEEEYPKDLVQQVQTTIHLQLEEFGNTLTKQILPELAANRIFLYYNQTIRPEHAETVREYFLSKVLSFLQPVILRKENQADVFLENNALYFIVSLESPEQPGKHLYGLLNIPSSNLPRFFELTMLDDVHYIIFLDDVIRENLQEVFPVYIIHGAWSVKLTRDAEMNIEDEFIGDIADKIEKQLEKRDVGHATRLLYDKEITEPAKEYVQKYFMLRNDEMAEGGCYHNLKDLSSLPNPRLNDISGQTLKEKLTYHNWPPASHCGFDNHRSVFQSITENEKLLHLPYHSYNYILRFFNEAAIDPNVKEIYIALYRVAADSHIVNALISAAKNGKKVTVFVELKARFDEANNLRWSKRMKAAGIKIIYSIPGLKVHAKVALVRKAENLPGPQGGKELKNYSFLATGNFNEATGRFYTDHVLFTAEKEFGQDLEWLFEYLQSRKQPSDYMKIPFRHLLVSQFNMVKRFEKMIEQEIKNARKGRYAGIIIKLNNLQERNMIEKLYEASRAGVKVQLMIRSICTLSPGIEGQSENISVHRIVDRYLEHSRIFVFHNNGEPLYFMGSADWMNRNLHSRIEVVFPLYCKKLCEEMNHILQLQLGDTRKAVWLKSNLENERIPVADGKNSVASQEEIYLYVKGLT